MNSPFLRLLRISLTSLFLFFFLLYILRGSGLSTAYAPLDHPLVQEPFLLISGGVQKEGLPPQSLESLKRVYELSPKILLKVDLQMTKDTKFVLYSYETLEEATGAEGFLIHKTLKEAQSIFYKESSQTLLSFEDFLKAFPKARILVDLKERDPAKYVPLKKQLERHNKMNEVIFYSRFPEPLRFMRKENPLWPFAIATTDLTQALILDSLFLEPLARMKGDFIISPLKLTKNQKAFTPSLVQEYKRRHLKIILMDYHPKEPLPTGLDKIHGVITPEPQLFLEF